MMVIKFKHNNTDTQNTRSWPRLFRSLLLVYHSHVRRVYFCCYLYFVRHSLHREPLMNEFLGKEEGRGLHSMYTHMSIVRTLLEFCLPFSATEHKKKHKQLEKKTSKKLCLRIA